MRRLASRLAWPAVVLVLCATIGATGCSEPAPSGTPAEQSPAAAPATTATPMASPVASSPAVTSTPTPAPPEATPVVVAITQVDDSEGGAATRAEETAPPVKSPGDLPPDPKPPRSESTPTPQPVGAVGVRSADAVGAADSGKEAAAEEPSYTWYDGDRTRTVWLHSDGAEPVFRTETGELLTLPGGVGLILDPAWDQARVDQFFTENEVDQGLVSRQSFGANAFFIETDPGLPSIELANALAIQDGVQISSPNWRREVETR